MNGTANHHGEPGQSDVHQQSSSAPTCPKERKIENLQEDLRLLKERAEAAEAQTTHWFNEYSKAETERNNTSNLLKNEKIVSARAVAEEGEKKTREIEESQRKYMDAEKRAMEKKTLADNSEEERRKAQRDLENTKAERSELEANNKTLVQRFHSSQKDKEEIVTKYNNIVEQANGLRSRLEDQQCLMVESVLNIPYRGEKLMQLMRGALRTEHAKSIKPTEGKRKLTAKGRKQIGKLSKVSRKRNGFRYKSKKAPPPKETPEEEAGSSSEDSWEDEEDDNGGPEDTKSVAVYKKHGKMEQEELLDEHDVKENDLEKRQGDISGEEAQDDVDPLEQQSSTAQTDGVDDNTLWNETWAPSTQHEPVNSSAVEGIGKIFKRHSVHVAVKTGKENTDTTGQIDQTMALGPSSITSSDPVRHTAVVSAATEVSSSKEQPKKGEMQGIAGGKVEKANPTAFAADEQDYRELDNEAHKESSQPWSSRAGVSFDEAITISSDDDDDNVATRDRLSNDATDSAVLFTCAASTVTFGHAAEIAEGKLSNSLVDFYLAALVERIDPEIRDSVYLFSSFHYGRLTQPQPMCDVNRITEESSRYEMVKRNYETMAERRSRELFDSNKHFIVIPVLQDEHWYLIIILHPYKCIIHGIEDPNARKQGYNVDEGLRKATTHVIIFDSDYDGSDRMRESSIDIIRDYLEIEFKSMKENEEISDSYRFSILDRALLGVIRSMFLPQQAARRDSGLYLLKYAELFLINPPPPEKLCKGVYWYELYADPIEDVRDIKNSLCENIRMMASDETWSLYTDYEKKRRESLDCSRKAPKRRANMQIKEEEPEAKKDAPISSRNHAAPHYPPDYPIQHQSGSDELDYYTVAEFSSKQVRALVEYITRDVEIDGEPFDAKWFQFKHLDGVNFLKMKMNENDCEEFKVHPDVVPILYDAITRINATKKQC